MIELNFGPDEEAKPVEDDLADTPIPTYEEWLEGAAKDIGSNPWIAMAKAGFALMKYAAMRESLFMGILIHKEIITADELKELYGEESLEAAESGAIKNITKYIVREAAKGALTDATGSAIDPDKALTILNDILDFNKTGYNGRTVEIIAEISGHPGSLMDTYEEAVKGVKEINQVREARRRNRKLKAERAAKDREERERRVRIFVSKCRVVDKPVPSDETQRSMVNGTIPIPERP